MHNFIKKLKGPSRLVYVISAFVYAALFAIVSIGQAAFSGDFMPILAGLIIMIAGTGAIASAPALVLAKLEKPAKIIFAILAGYWVISQTQGFISFGGFATKNAAGIAVATGIFGFLTGLIMLTMLVFLVLYFALGKKPQYLSIAFILLLATVLFALITGILRLAALGSNAAWPDVLQTISDYFLLPSVVAFGYIYFFTENDEEPKEITEEPTFEDSDDIN